MKAKMIEEQDLRESTLDSIPALVEDTNDLNRKLAIVFDKYNQAIDIFSILGSAVIGMCLFTYGILYTVHQEAPLSSVFHIIVGCVSLTFSVLTIGLTYSRARMISIDIDSNLYQIEKILNNIEEEEQLEDQEEDDK